MKMMKKVAGIALALVMALALMAPAFAAEMSEYTITITPPAGTATTVTNTYTVYKVFDAVGNGNNISYKLVSGKTEAPDGFAVDDAGNVTYAGSSSNGQLTDADIAAIAAYVAGDNPVATAESTGMNAAVADVKDFGYYYITTTNGTAVTVDSTNPNVEVEDKNEVPPVTKEQHTPVNVEIGDTIDYTITIGVKKGAESYVLHDTMGTGLSLKEDSFEVKVDGADVAAENYTLTTSGLSDGCTFEISFGTTYLAGVENKNIVVTYSATINDTAAIPDGATVTNTNNTAKLRYGSDDSTSVPTSTNVELFKFDLVKTDKDKNLLDGAKFELYDGKDVATGEDADGNTTYTLNEGAQAIAFVENDGVYKVSTSSTADTTITVTDGQVTVEGLNGTYYLKETEAPAGYNLLPTLTPVSVTANNVATAEDGVYTAGGVQVINNSGTELPSTGGIGTTIFYIGGSILVAGAAILLITKKRMGSVD